jgi:hypothetical protein
MTTAKLVWDRTPYRGAVTWSNPAYVIEKRHGSFRVFNRWAKRLVTDNAKTLLGAKALAQEDFDKTTDQI